ncbi:MAG: MBL fold metallo-hydrolase, partial [Candidatus Marinimicrobia bacterium]|nr:MBL fold metallo-hydrolase [Candidatus Neomarinimicrobiota bacterium]
MKDIYIDFWGVRGSVPSPGSETIRYGGNTSCISITVENK